MSPKNILLGKLLGEPAHAYLFAMAIIPILVWCSVLGAVDGPALFLLLVNLFTFIAMAGAFGLLHSLELPARKSNSSGSSVVAIVVLALFGIPWFIAIVVQLGGGLNNHWFGPLLGLLTPTSAIFGVSQHDPWSGALYFYGYYIPYLILTPFVQLGLVAVIFRSMCRRMINTVVPLFSKRITYAILIVVDLIMVGLLLDDGSFTIDSSAICLTFSVFHIAVSLFLTFGATPTSACLSSWIWRFKGERSPSYDWFVSDRSPVLGASLVYSAVGLVFLFVGVVLPQRLVNATPADPLVLGGCALAIACVPWIHAVINQILALIVGRTAGLWFCMLAIVLSIAPFLFALFFDHRQLMVFSPWGMLVAYFENTLPIWGAIPTVAAYVLFGIVFYFFHRRWLRSTTSRVQHTLASMKSDKPREIESAAGVA